LTTDFGVKDAFVATMKGVILSICSEARIVDISHEVPKYNIRYGAFLLSQASPYYPKGIIHVAVIDPGVGTDRRRIIVEGRREIYVGPDNGVFSMVMELEGVVRVVEIRDKRFMLPHVSNTFEGRDVFAPVAAHLAKGVKIEEFGPEIQDPVKLQMSRVEIVGRTVVGEIIHIDGFGNIITNIQMSSLKEAKLAGGCRLMVGINKISKEMPFCKAYGEMPVGKLLTIIGSSGFMEISVNQGSAEMVFKAEVGDAVKLSLVKKVA